jgi:membrane-bound serine protease (ClpP class)
MRVLRLGSVLLWLAGALMRAVAPAGSPSSRQGAPVVKVLDFNAEVNPITAGYVRRGIADAERIGAAALVLEINTPGGLMSSMDEITQMIINSPVPVIAYVTPSGARAASAGVFITYASHVAAMAPATNIGSAHPVDAGGGGGAQPDTTPAESNSDEQLFRKITNDAVARIRNYAELRGRNADWAEQAVRESVNVGATEALQLHVIDLIAPDLPTLLNEVDGREVAMVGGAKLTLHTKGAAPQANPLTWVEQFLLLIATPQIAFLLLSTGSLAITVELFNPGSVFPGVIGVILILLAFLSLGTLPVNGVGLAFIAFAFVCFIADVFVSAHGILTAGGILSLMLGGLLLIDPTQAPGIEGVPITTAIGTALGIGGVFFFAVYKVIQLRRRRPTTGRESLVGREAQTRQALDPNGLVFFNGELWQATSTDGPIPAGRLVQVVAVDGLLLRVAPVPPPTITAPLPPEEPLPIDQRAVSSEPRAASRE